MGRGGGASQAASEPEQQVIQTNNTREFGSILGDHHFFQVWKKKGRWMPLFLSVTMPCRTPRPLKPPVVQVKTTVIVLVGTLSIDDVEHVHISRLFSRLPLRTNTSH